MVEIIPVILVKDFSEAFARIQAVKSCVDWMQIDVVDGEFAPNVSWGDPEALRGIDTHIRFEIDLMVIDPESVVKEWVKAAPRVGRIYFHQEAVSVNVYSPGAGRAHNIITRIKKAGIEVGMSINPKTSIEVLYPFVPRLDAVLFLGVEPGFGGQEFLEPVYDKVNQFHRKFPQTPIEVDGGVKVGVVKRLVEAGATRLAANTSVFQEGIDPIKALEELRRDVI